MDIVRRKLILVTIEGLRELTLTYIVVITRVHGDTLYEIPP